MNSCAHDDEHWSTTVLRRCPFCIFWWSLFFLSLFFCPHPQSTKSTTDSIKRLSIDDRRLSKLAQHLSKDYHDRHRCRQWALSEMMGWGRFDNDSRSISSFWGLVKQASSYCTSYNRHSNYFNRAAIIFRARVNNPKTTGQKLSVCPTERMRY